MTDQKKRKRPRGGRSGGVSPTTHMEIIETPHGLVGMPEWNWRAFPVYFALTLGLFVGLYIGILAEYTRANGNGSVVFIAFLVTGIPFSFALSRIFTRILMKRGLIKPRGRRA